MAAMEFKGIAASPGVAIGPIVVLSKTQALINYRELAANWEVDWEVERLERALAATKEEFTAARAEMTHTLNDFSSLLDAYILLLDDKMIKQRTRLTIETQKVNAEWALNLTLNQAEQLFADITDAYIKDRFRDIMAVIDHIMRNLSGGLSPEFKIQEPSILVTHDLTPADITRLNTSMILGLATDQGGPTSHTAIIARALGLPAVQGLEKISSTARNGDKAIIDGAGGLLLLSPSRAEIDFYQDQQVAYKLYLEEMTALADLPSHTLDGVQVEVGANIEMLEEISSVHKFGGQSVGLYRTEFSCLSFNRKPTEEEMFDNLRRLVLGLNGLSVTIRTLDIGGEKLVGFTARNDEINPNLGLRGIRYSIKERPFFLRQLRAILRASHYGSIKILFPMVTSVEEIIIAKQCLQEAGDSLEREKLPFAGQVEVGVMIEVPAAVIAADILAREVDFFSIGTNDLIQYSMAIDRNNEQVKALYQPLHVAILRIIRQVAQAARGADIDLHMCGEMAGNPRYAPLILGLGVHKLSMSPGIMPRIKEVVSQVNLAYWQQVAEEAMSLSTVAQVEELLDLHLKNQMPDLFGGK
jgi:phosphotransferase system enzyme I (PtsI)